MLAVGTNIHVTLNETLVPSPPPASSGGDAHFLFYCPHDSIRSMYTLTLTGPVLSQTLYYSLNLVYH